jgi:hypothetical protein
MIFFPWDFNYNTCLVPKFDYFNKKKASFGQKMMFPFRLTLQHSLHYGSLWPEDWRKIVTN